MPIPLNASLEELIEYHNIPNDLIDKIEDLIDMNEYMKSCILDIIKGYDEYVMCELDHLEDSISLMNAIYELRGVMK